MDFRFSEEQLLLANSVREFTARECPREYIREMEKRDEYPEDLFKKIAQNGWLVCTSSTFIFIT